MEMVLLTATGWSPPAGAAATAPATAGRRAGGAVCSGRRTGSMDHMCEPGLGEVSSVTIRRCPQPAEQLCAHSTPVRELVVPIPAPRRDHRPHHDPARA